MGKQEFMAVQCCQCSAFQVQQVKKVNKFACSLCSFKQSVQRVYAKSNQAKDAREVVQAYNSARSCAEAEADEAALEGACDQWQPAEEELWQPVLGGQTHTVESKWAGFAEDENEQWTVVLPEKVPAGKAANNGAKRRRVQDQGRGTDEDIGWGAAGHSSGSMAQERKALAWANYTRPPAAAQDDSRPALAGKQQQPQQILWGQQHQQRNVQRPDCAHTVVQAVGTGRQPQAGLQQSWQAGWQGGQQQTTGGAGKWASFVGDDDE